MRLRIAVRTLLATALLAVACPSPAASYPNTSNFGVPYSEDESWYQQCMRVERHAAPGYGEGKAAPGCNAGELYYRKRDQAVTSAAEWRQVRGCALAREDDAVLMMLYANGFGVERDTDVAIHHACKLGFIAKAEMEGRIAHLAAPQRAGAVFDQCDDVTSGTMGSICAGIRAGQSERKRENRLDRMAADLPASARAAFARLRQAAGRYAGAAEVDMQGSGAAGFAIAHEARMLAQFDELLPQVMANRLPPASPQDADRADRELNAVYRTLMTPTPSERGRPERLGESTITRQAVREAERRWIAYRDTFLAFRARLPSGASADAINAALTRERLAQLKRLSAYR